MSNKVVLITGGNTGIGFETAKVLVSKGYHVILGVRSKDKGEEAVDQIKKDTGRDNIEHDLVDLADLSSVRVFASNFLKRNLPLHVLINNAGIAFTPYGKTKDGFETHFQVNHLGHFLLSLLLIDKLKESKPARIINLSSRAHIRWTKPIDFSKLEPNADETKEYTPSDGYSRSKLANVLFTYELHRRLNRSAFSGVCVNALHPGFVDTQMTRGKNLPFGIPIEVKEGAETSIFLASEMEVETESGKYWYSCKPEETTSLSHDENQQRELWEHSVKWTGVDFQ